MSTNTPSVTFFNTEKSVPPKHKERLFEIVTMIQERKKETLKELLASESMLDFNDRIAPDRFTMQAVYLEVNGYREAAYALKNPYKTIRELAVEHGYQSILDEYHVQYATLSTQRLSLS